MNPNGNGLSLFPALLLTLLSGAIVYTTYNLFLHPLAKFPGPLLWRAFRFPFVFNYMSGTLPYRVREFHARYGEVVRVGPDELSFTDPAAWRDIYPKNFQRPYEYKGKPPGKPAENLISASEPDHARFRRILGPAFTEKAISQQEPLVKTYVDKFIEKLHQLIERQDFGDTSHAVVEMVQWFNYVAFDVIGDLTWGSSFDCLEEAQVHPWIQTVSQYKTALILGSSKFYPPLFSLLTLITPTSAKLGIMQMWRTTEEKVSQRLDMKVQRPDIMSHILHENESESPLHMSRSEIEVNAMMLVIGGSDAVTTILTGAMIALLREPDKLHILTSEIRSTFSREADIMGSSVKNLSYLNAVLIETMRLCPSIPDGMRRNVPPGGATVAGHQLPEATVVSIPQWAAYQSQHNFQSPATFAPERWLPESSTPSSPFFRDRKEVFHPFSLGPHGCPGTVLAWLELRLILSRLLWNFDIHLVRGKVLPQWEKQRIYWVWDKQPTHVGISKCER